MAESDREWGELNAHDNEMAEVWDSFHRLPDPGQNAALDLLCERKHIDVPALVRLGAKLTEPGGTVLAFAWDGGIKYRDMVTGRRWTYLGSDFSRLKLIRAAEPTMKVVVAEGETDAARLTMLYPEADVAVMGGGARYVTDAMIEELANYSAVFVALDNDSAGNDGAAKILERIINGVRWLPPAGDWCESAESDVVPLPDELERPPEAQLLVSAGDLFNLEYLETASYFEHELLPVGGSAIIHGWVKGFKSFQALDMMAALAQGQPWACFEPMEEPVRVGVMQYEIPPPYYKERVRLLERHAREPELLRENFLTWTPLQRPRLRADDKAEQDRVLAALVDAGVQVFLLDPVRRAMGTLNSNAEEDVRKLLAFFERLQDEGITVVTVHHDNKESARAKGGDPIGMTGSGAWAGDFDTIISISIPKGMALKDPKRNLTFTLRNAPSIGDRGMEIDGDGKITYSTEPWGEWDDADYPADPTLPPI